MIEVGVAFVDVFEEGGAFFFVERLVVGAWEGGVEVVFDGKAEGGACLGAFSPVEDEEGFDTEEEMLGDFFDFVAFGGGKFGGRAGKDVEDDELLLGEVFADMRSSSLSRELERLRRSWKSCSMLRLPLL